MKQNDQIISIPSSPASTSTSSASPESPVHNDKKENKMLLKLDNSDQSKKTNRYLKKRLRSCREKTLESEICKTIQKFFSSCMSDDNCRRIIAIVIMILAVIGLFHIIKNIIINFF